MTSEKRAIEQYADVLETMKRVHAADMPDGFGTVKCARCLGTLKYRKETKREKRPRRSRPGRVLEVWSRGQCETEGCLSWIV